MLNSLTCEHRQIAFKCDIYEIAKFLKNNDSIHLDCTQVCSAIDELTFGQINNFSITLLVRSFLTYRDNFLQTTKNHLFNLNQLTKSIENKLLFFMYSRSPLVSHMSPDQIIYVISLISHFNYDLEQKTKMLKAIYQKID